MGTLTGDIGDVLQALRAMAPQFIANGIIWYLMRTGDGYEAYVNGVLRGEVRFRTDAEMVTGGINEWSCHDPATRE